jgi:hypothetical protein
VISIVTNGRFFYPEFEGESYGAYNSVVGLIDDLRGGHTFSFPRGIQTENLDIPDDISEWHEHSK